MKYEIDENIKGLIFDLDGTLVDSMPLHYEGWKLACERFGARIDPGFLRYHTGSPGWAIAAAIIENSGLTGKVTPQDIMKVKLEEFYKVQHLIKPIEPVADIVKRYHGKIPMSVGTGGHREAVERSLSVAGLRDYFEVVVTANDVTKHKPDPETFLKCSEMMGVAPEQTEVFEDGDLGIEAANRAGMKATDVRPWYVQNW